MPVPIYSAVHPEHHSSPGELPAPYYEATGPGTYSHSRTEAPSLDLVAWGLGEYPASWDTPTDPPPQQPQRFTYPARPQVTCNS